eukprot:jgi/Chlat1/5436/Chrsp36S05442
MEVLGHWAAKKQWSLRNAGRATQDSKVEQGPVVESIAQLTYGSRGRGSTEQSSLATHPFCSSPTIAKGKAIPSEVLLPLWVN